MMLYPLNIKKHFKNSNKKELNKEFDTMETVFTSENIHQYFEKTQQWMQILVNADYNSSGNKVTHDWLSKMREEEVDVSSMLYLHSMAIYSAPKTFPVLRSMMLERARLLSGIKDTKAHIYGIEKTNELFGHVTMAELIEMYCKEALNAFHANESDTVRYFIRKMKKALKDFDDPSQKHMIKEWNEKIEYMESQLFTSLDLNKWLPSNRRKLPDKVFNDERYYPLGKDRITANVNLIMGDKILVEKPRIGILIEKGFQCDNCYKIANLLPCFECRLIFYCCKECEEDDYRFHKYECIGLRSRILYLTRSQIDLRNLILTMHDIKKCYLDKIHEQKIESVADFWENFIGKVYSSEVENKDGVPKQYYEFFCQFTNLNELNDDAFDFICTKVAQLTFYLKTYTTFFEDFLGHIKELNDNEKQIWISTLLLRHAAIQHTKLVNLEQKFQLTGLAAETYVNIPKTKEIDNALFESTKNVIKKFYDDCYTSFKTSGSYEIEKKKLKVFLKKLEGAADELNLLKPPDTTYNTFLEATTLPNIYTDLLTDFTDFNWDHSVVDEELFYTFTKMVNIHPRFRVIPIAYNSLFDQKIECLYSKLSQFRHNCDPNTIVLCSLPGHVTLKACRKIEINEEITVSYGPHYLRHCRQDRTKKLSELNLKCECDACTIDVDVFEQINNEECKSCRHPIYEGAECCEKCLTPSITLLPKRELIYLLINYQNNLETSENPEDKMKEHNVYITTLNFIAKFLHPDSPILLKQLTFIARVTAYSDEPLLAFGYLPRLYYTAKRNYPPLSNELFENLSVQLKIYISMLTNAYELRSPHFKNKPDDLHEMIQEASKLCEEVNLILLAWDLGQRDSRWYALECEKRDYGQVVDKIYEYIAKKEEVELMVKRKLEERNQLNNSFDELEAIKLEEALSMGSDEGILNMTI